MNGLGPLLFYLMFLALVSLAISSPVAIAAVAIGWLAGKVRGKNPRTTARVTSLTSLWLMAALACFLVDGTGEIVWVLLMAGVWTIPVMQLASALADRGDTPSIRRRADIERRMRELEKEAKAGGPA